MRFPSSLHSFGKAFWNKYRRVAGVISVLSNDVLYCWLHGSRYEVTAEWKDPTRQQALLRQKDLQMTRENISYFAKK
jgi:hypothetical protein